MTALAEPDPPGCARFHLLPPVGSADSHLLPQFLLRLPEHKLDSGRLPLMFEHKA